MSIDVSLLSLHDFLQLLYRKIHTDIVEFSRDKSTHWELLKSLQNTVAKKQYNHNTGDDNKPVTHSLIVVILSSTM